MVKAINPNIAKNENTCMYVCMCECMTMVCTLDYVQYMVDRDQDKDNIQQTTYHNGL